MSVCLSVCVSIPLPTSRCPVSVCLSVTVPVTAIDFQMSSICLSVYLCVCLSVPVSVTIAHFLMSSTYMFDCLSMCLYQCMWQLPTSLCLVSVWLPIYVSVCICLTCVCDNYRLHVSSICLSVYLSLFVCLYLCLWQLPTSICPVSQGICLSVCVSVPESVTATGNLKVPSASYLGTQR